MNNNNWGGKREGAGRRPKIAGEGRKMCSMRATVSEWEEIKKFARILKDNPEKARKLLENQ